MGVDRSDERERDSADDGDATIATSQIQNVSESLGSWAGSWRTEARSPVGLRSACARFPIRKDSWNEE